MRPLRQTVVLAWVILLGLAGVSISAVTNGTFTATWTPATDAAEQYEFRWRHFASDDWLALPTMPGPAGSMRVTFTALPTVPTTDRWMCVDARMVTPTVGAWLSETSDGPSCNTVDVAVIPVPTPPPPIPTPPAPAPSPIPPQPNIFTNLQQADGRLSLEYQVGACPRGVQQTTGALKNGRRTITLTCRR
ncbi:MAG: hypothetical protein H8K09_13145 [Nitrospira sp.]|nr:hypothetical protein [Nitrospira sp.]